MRRGFENRTTIIYQLFILPFQLKPFCDTMAEIVEGIKPTRMELLQIKKRLALAEKGHKLLTEKRNALISEFFEIIKKYKDSKNQADILIKKSFNLLIEAEMISGQKRIRDATRGGLGRIEIDAKYDNIMGVKVPRLSIKNRKKPVPFYGFVGTNSRLDDAFFSFNEATERVVELAETEKSIENLAVEIEKTKRRVNALEHIFIPKLKNTEKYIRMQLEEREREDFFRKKRVKALMAR